MGSYMSYKEALPSWWPAKAEATDTVPSLVASTVTVNEGDKAETREFYTVN